MKIKDKISIIIQGVVLTAALVGFMVAVAVVLEMVFKT